MDDQQPDSENTKALKAALRLALQSFEELPRIGAGQDVEIRIQTMLEYVSMQASVLKRMYPDGV